MKKNFYTNDEKDAQVGDQCEAVAILATGIATVHTELARMFRDGEGMSPAYCAIVGKRTARLMEELGDILNEMDAADDKEIEKLTPIFDVAHELWPASKAP